MPPFIITKEKVSLITRDYVIINLTWLKYLNSAHVNASQRRKLKYFVVFTSHEIQMLH